MTLYFYILFLLSGLTGTDSVTTVRKVSVKAGQSLSIPCLYDRQYRNHVKYLCKGFYWNSCSYAIKTNERQRSSKFSVSHDEDQRIFTVTMRELTAEDSDFWCVVEIDRSPDVGRYFHLSVTTGTPILNVNDQEITGFVGENVSIEFQKYTSEGIKWCRFGGSCVANPSGFIDGTSVIINKTDLKVFTVTMSELKPESGGWYVLTAGDYQMPVHVTVHAIKSATTAATAGGTVKQTIHVTKPTTTAATTGGTVKQETVVTTLGNQRNGTVFDRKNVTIPLSVLIAIAIVTLIIWLLLNRKRAVAEEPDTTKDGEEETPCNVQQMRHNASQSSYDEREADVLGSSAVTRKEQNAKMGSPATSDEDVMFTAL